MRPIVGFLLVCFAVLSSAILVVSIGSLSPYTQDTAPKVAFFGSLATTIAAVVASGLIFFYRRLYHGRSTPLMAPVRQGLFVGILISLLLALSANQLLGWWEALPLVIAVICAEAFFQADRLRTFTMGRSAPMASPEAPEEPTS